MSGIIGRECFDACEQRLRELCEDSGLLVVKLAADEDGVLLSVELPNKRRLATYETGRMSEVVVNRWVQEKSDGLRHGGDSKQADRAVAYS
jgi:hypothetical protein